MNINKRFDGRGFVQPETSIIPTMSSIQMVEYINADRQSKLKLQA
jgi:hypothetical protein